MNTSKVVSLLFVFSLGHHESTTKESSTCTFTNQYYRVIIQNRNETFAHIIPFADKEQLHPRVNCCQYIFKILCLLIKRGWSSGYDVCLTNARSASSASFSCTSYTNRREFDPRPAYELLFCFVFGFAACLLIFCLLYFTLAAIFWGFFFLRDFSEVGWLTSVRLVVS